MKGQFQDLKQAALDAAHDPELGKQRIDAIRLNIDALKWQLSKLLPRKYGDKQSLEITGKEGSPLYPQRTRKEMEEFAEILASVRAKIAAAGGGESS